MRRIAFLSSWLILVSLTLAGCDKCGQLIKFDAPSIPKACYDDPEQK